VTREARDSREYQGGIGLRAPSEADAGEYRNSSVASLVKRSMATMRVVSAKWAVTVLAIAVLASACAGESGGSEEARSLEPADAVGVVTSVSKDGATVAVGFAADEGYEYFDGTTFNIATSGGLQDADGLAADPNNLSVGDHIEVWVNACAESYPVQCSEPLARIAPESGVN